jgi:hypothetical protein
MPAKTAVKNSKSLYNVHPGVEMTQRTIAAMKEKTGRTLDEWVRLIKKEGPPAEKDRREWLKTKHGMGTNYAWWLAMRADGKGMEDEDPETYLKSAAAWVEKLYSGKKEALRPIHDALMKLGRKLGSDVRICPCQTMVPLYRNHVFAQIKPTTNTRIDLGFALKGAKPKLPKRLIDTGGLEKKDRITHRIALTSVEEIDAEVTRWLKIAYDLDA